jgi:hypothetical protein
MIYVEAPNYAHDQSNLPKVFLGGGITNCKDWQSDLVQEIDDLNCIVYNPRRKSFDINDPNQSTIQIHWEFNYLNAADIVVFYFCEETVCPITLFEYGARLMHNHFTASQSIYVYCEDKYIRKLDVNIQAKMQLAMSCFTYQANDVQVFDNYDLFVLTLSERIRKER